MHILLINTQGQADHPLLEFLNRELSDEIKEQFNVGGASSDFLNQGTTSIVAVGNVKTEEQAKAVEAAVAKYGSPSFKVVRGGLVVDSKPVTGAFEYDAIAGEGGQGVFAEVTSVSEQLAKIFTSGPSGIDWPETKYSGIQEKIYRYIVEQLKGIEPYKDYGETISPADIDRIQNKKGWDKKAWNEVTDHLRAELKYFQFAKEWYGDNGHVKTFCMDQAFMNYIFIDTVNDTYLKVPSDKGITIFLDALMNVVSKSVSLAGPEGKVLGIVLSTAWIIAKGTMGANSKIATQIVRAKTDLAGEYGRAIEGVVGCKLKLYKDWGKLQEFGQMIATHELQWPVDPRKFHVKASVAYHAYAMQLLLPLSNWPFVISVAQKGKANQKRRWEPQKGNYHLYTHAENQGGCKGWWYLEYFLGNVHYLDLEPYADEAPKNLQRKMFGLSQSNIADPELNINPGFYLKNPWKLMRFSF